MKFFLKINFIFLITIDIRVVSLQEQNKPEPIMTHLNNVNRNISIENMHDVSSKEQSNVNLIVIFLRIKKY